MSIRFPARRSVLQADEGALRLLAGVAVDAEDRSGLPWVIWLFQGVRAQCDALAFRTSALERVAALADWQRFAGEQFLPVLAPALLRAWRAAQAGDDAGLGASDRGLEGALPAAALARVARAGWILLEQTRGAKHQAALGRYRQGVAEGRGPGHLPVVWAAVAALFQLPPLDLLAEYLREEWMVATRHCPHHEVPQGPLSFSGLAHRALHEAGVFAAGE